MPRITRKEPTALLELRMAARLTGVDEHAIVEAAEALSADLHRDPDAVADLLTGQLLAGLGLGDAIATVPLDVPPAGQASWC